MRASDFLLLAFGAVVIAGLAFAAPVKAAECQFTLSSAVAGLEAAEPKVRFLVLDETQRLAFLKDLEAAAEAKTGNPSADLSLKVSNVLMAVLQNEVYFGLEMIADGCLLQPALLSDFIPSAEKRSGYIPAVGTFA